MAAPLTVAAGAPLGRSLALGRFRAERSAATGTASQPAQPLLSILVPAYNEARTIGAVLEQAADLPVPHEVIVVDDGSSDGTADVVREYREVRLLRHERNRGKGAAIATALVHARGALVVVQDADLEYRPSDILPLYERYLRGGADAVYGSRIRGRNPRSSQAFYWGGRFLSGFTNLLYGSSITDESTGYKLLSAALLRSCAIRAKGFDFCAELTARILSAGGTIAEVPIGYLPRGFADGKKITARDGFIAIWVLLRERVRARGRAAAAADLRVRVPAAAPVAGLVERH